MPHYPRPSGVATAQAFRWSCDNYSRLRPLRASST